MTAAVEAFVHAGYDLDAAAILLCESDGTAGRGRARGRPHDRGARGGRRDAAGGERQRGRAAEVLERAQERLSGERPDQPRLHVHGLDHPAQAPRRHAAGDRRDGAAPRPALRQRLPRRRRQPASADPVRCQRQRPAASRRGLRRRDPRPQRRDGRHGHRRARRRRREAVVDVRAVLARRARADGRGQARLRSGRPAQPRQGASRPWCAAPSTGRCTSSAAWSRFPTCRGFERPRRTRPVRAGRAPARRQRLAPRRSACAAAAARTSTARRRAATCSTCAASTAPPSTSRPSWSSPRRPA